VWVRPDAVALELACEAFEVGRLQFDLGARFQLSQAGAALALAVEGRGGAVVLDL